MRKVIICLFVAICLPALADDVSGVWKVDGTVADTPVNATCTLRQTNTAISGNCKVSGEKTAGQTPDIKGEVKDKQVTWTYQIEYEGTLYTLTYAGALQDPATSIKGSIAVDPSDSKGEFTAQKQ
jgi:hypothetical protein